MPKVTCVSACENSRWEIDASSGSSLMEAAVTSNVPGIVAECGGSCSCATCHVYVAAEWLDQLEEPTEEETDLIEFLDGARPNSRLSCQIIIRDDLDGLVLHVPETQE